MQHASVEEIVGELKHHPRLVAADDFEVCVQQTDSYSSDYVDGQEIKKKLRGDTWLSLRLIYRKQLGCSATFLDGRDSLNVAVEKAFAASASATPDPWFRFPLLKRVPKNEDPKAKGPTPVMLSSQLNDVGAEGLQVFESYGYWYRCGFLYRRFDRGELFYESQGYLAELGILVATKKRNFSLKEHRERSCSWGEGAQWLPKLLARSQAFGMANEWSGTQPETYLFRPAVVSRILSQIAWWWCANEILSGRSPLGKRVGEKIWASAIRLVDEGALAGGALAVPFDNEGMGTTRTELVKDGALQGFLHNAYTATRHNQQSTGNFLRGLHQVESTVTPTNFFVEASHETPKALLSSMANGVVLDFADRVNVFGQKLCIEASGWRVEKGELGDPFFGLRLECDAMKLFGSAVAVGNDLSFLGRFGSPSILFEKVPLN